MNKKLKTEIELFLWEEVRRKLVYETKIQVRLNVHFCKPYLYHFEVLRDYFYEDENYK
jgi:hypothetical protein